MVKKTKSKAARKTKPTTTPVAVKESKQPSATTRKMVTPRRRAGVSTGATPDSPIKSGVHTSEVAGVDSESLASSEVNQVTLSSLELKKDIASSKGARSRSKIGAKTIPNSITPADSSKPLPLADAALKERLTKNSTGSLQSPLRIFQYYQDAWQRELLDPNFVAMNSSKTTSEFQEFAVFEKIAKSDYIKGAQLWGALSWRFSELTGMGGADLIKYIKAHPGADVYFCNPYIHNEAIFQNVWLQGETAHPNFLALCQGVFTVTGLPIEELTSVNSSESFASCNYFIATPKFWNAYLSWVGAIIRQANKKLPAKVRDLMHSVPPGDSGSAHPGATYITFIVERLFPIFMKTAGKNFKSHKVPLPERARELNVHLKLLREMKDMAHKTKSAWLAACWVNYRNLYCTQASGKAWCAKHLRNITPAEVKFS